MGPQNDEADQAPLSKQAQDLDYSSFEAEDRRRKVFLIAAGVVFAILCAAAFIGTIESIGSMSAHVNGIFDTQPAEPAK